MTNNLAIIIDTGGRYARLCLLMLFYLHPRIRIQMRAKPRTSKVRTEAIIMYRYVHQYEQRESVVSSSTCTITGTHPIHKAVCAQTKDATHKPLIEAKRSCSLSSHLSFLQAYLLNCTKTTNTKKRNHASLGDYATMLHSSGDSTVGSTSPQLRNTTLVQTAQIR
jgi:hypothetical protein